MSELGCLDCGEPMVEVRRHGVVIDHCEACGGHWFDQGELRAWVKSEGSDPEELLDEGFWTLRQTCPSCRHENPPVPDCQECGRHLARQCPRDGTDMHVLSELSVTIDICEQCHGIWFDVGELVDLMGAWERQTGVAGLPRCEDCGSVHAPGEFRCRDCRTDRTTGNFAAIQRRRAYTDSIRRLRDTAEQRRATLPDPTYQPDVPDDPIARSLMKLIG